jgi:uncharacterized protein (DUF3084 family)
MRWKGISMFKLNGNSELKLSIANVLAIMTLFFSALTAIYFMNDALRDTIVDVKDDVHIVKTQLATASQRMDDFIDKQEAQCPMRTGKMSGVEEEIHAIDKRVTVLENK